MRSSILRALLLCMVALLAFVGGACGSSDDDANGGDTTEDSDGPELELVKGDRFTVLLPKGAKLETQPVDEQSGLMLNLYSVEIDGVLYGVNYTDVPAGTPINVDGAIEGSASNIGGQAVDKQALTYKTFEAMDARIVGVEQGGAKGTGFTRVVATPGRMYQIITIASGEDLPVSETHIKIRESLEIAS